jgi:hypothetical protein
MFHVKQNENNFRGAKSVFTPSLSFSLSAIPAPPGAPQRQYRVGLSRFGASRRVASRPKSFQSLDPSRLAAVRATSV